jgi:hypothetical protein
MHLYIFPDQRERGNFISEAVIPPSPCKPQKAKGTNVVSNFILRKAERTNQCFI